ncbi:hypothetical protein MPSEU_000456300 [Mayamaea pseudoterrestris]|nr:hypothetical protein MPSEU_000456300 [Mayamaea pseudoterrestris]
MTNQEKEEKMLSEKGFLPPTEVAEVSPEEMEWLNDATLSIVVVGASGDLAKKMTFPSLLNLFDDKFLPENVRIFGYARSKMSSEDLHEKLRPNLTKKRSDEAVDRFLKQVSYQGGESYGDKDAFNKIKEEIEKYESEQSAKHSNRLFYFAIPPNVFGDTAVAIKETCMQDESKGWSRLIVEKPFGKDLESFEELNKTLSEHFEEDQMFRIDHYLGKEMVQNLNILRFSNAWFEPLWNRNHIQCVILTFKEPQTVEGRYGYFDQYGIILDVIQNHLLQVLTLLAMETPTEVMGPRSSKAIRDAKVAVLNSMSEITLDDVILGQYEGYTDDPDLENKDSNTPTFAMIRVKVNTPRWYGVPIILKAGKALDEHKSEVRIQFKDAPAAQFLFPHDVPRNELVMRLQPHEAIYMKTNVKSPGFSAQPIQSELEVNYDTRFFSHTKESNPDAYTRLILDVLQDKHAAFVRDDELRRAWEVFTPVLHKIEEENVRPIIYKQGSRGPVESDEYISRVADYKRNEDYVFYDGDVKKKSGAEEKK